MACSFKVWSVNFEIHARKFVLCAVLRNEFIFNFLSSLVGEVLNSLLVFFVFIEVVVQLTDDLLHEILSVTSLGVLIHDIDRVSWCN